MYEYSGKFLTLMLCSDCNNNCKHCYIKYKGQFTEETLKQLIPEFSKKYSIMFNGTEPIMHQEYFQFFKEAGAHSIMTNGLELMWNPELMDVLLDNGINQIWLSYHFGIQDDISLVKTEELNKLVITLKEKGFIVKLMTSLCKDNYRDVEKMCEKANDLGADRIRFTNFIYQGSASDNYSNSSLLTQEDIDWVLNKIDEIRNKYDKTKLYIDRCGSFGPKLKQENFECLAINKNVVMTPDGNIYMCVFDIDKGNEIGKLIDGKVMIYDEYQNTKSNYCRVLSKYNNIHREN